jgi:hypothetical protein
VAEAPVTGPPGDDVELGDAAVVVADDGGAVLEDVDELPQAARIRAPAATVRPKAGCRNEPVVRKKEV